jgi:hypothetical protein
VELDVTPNWRFRTDEITPASTAPSQSSERIEGEDLSAAEVDAVLAYPANAVVSRRAHQAAARMTALLCARYGMPAVRAFLRNGVPSEALKNLGS